MKIVIDISAEDFEKVKCGKVRWGKDAVLMMRKVIMHGTPLPKGHDRLIEAKRLKEVLRRNTGHDYHDLIDIAPTIIEADNTDSENKI